MDLPTLAVSSKIFMAMACRSDEITISCGLPCDFSRKRWRSSVRLSSMGNLSISFMKKGSPSRSFMEKSLLGTPDFLRTSASTPPESFAITSDATFQTHWITSHGLSHLIYLWNDRLYLRKQQLYFLDSSFLLLFSGPRIALITSFLKAGSSIWSSFFSFIICN